MMSTTPAPIWKFPPLLLLLLLGGCNLLSAAAVVAPKYIDAKYKGLANHSIGVMVWADRGISIDWPTVQLDLAGSIQKKLAASKADELKGTTYPVQVASIVRYQRDHPEIEAIPVEDIAPKLGVSRLIYVEVQELRTRSETAVELYRGSLSANIKVMEITNGKAKIGYQEDGVRVVFPKKSQPEGTPDGTDVTMYVGAIDEFSDEMLDTFTRHDAGDLE